MNILRYRLPFAAAALIILNSCGNNRQQKQDIPVYKNDSLHFYPVQQFLQTQIQEVSSTPYFLYKLTIENNHKDSVVLNRPEFLAATSMFTSYSIEDSTVKKYYKEEVFGDQTTNSITMTYSTRNDTLPIQSVTLLLNPETKKVKRLMMTLVQSNPDSTVTRKLNWTTGQSCSDITTIEKKGTPEHTRQTYLVWNGN